eukprot:3124308-Pleurochrysis_carterae.AAC.1
MRSAKRWSVNVRRDTACLACVWHIQQRRGVSITMPRERVSQRAKRSGTTCKTLECRHAQSCAVLVRHRVLAMLLHKGSARAK